MSTKHLLLILLSVSGWMLHAQVQQAEFSISPEVFGENDTIDIEVSGISPDQWGVDELYLWAWSFDANGDNPMDAPGNGTWNNSGESHKLIKLSDGKFGISLVPSVFFNRTGIGQIGMLVKAKNGSGDKKTQDYVVEVGRFQIHLELPEQSFTILDSAKSVVIRATTSEPATFTLLANGDSVFSSTQSDTLFQYDYTVRENTQFNLEAYFGDDSQTQEFTVVIKPEIQYKDLPAGMKDGINFPMDDSTSLVLVLYAPGKDWVHVIGNFNKWLIDDEFLMNVDTLQNRFWIELTDIDLHNDILFQYLVDFSIPIADPYSVLILDPRHDTSLDSTYGRPIPEYPAASTTEAVTWISSATSQYEWQNTGFVPPAREELVIYELLIRDFDVRHSFDAVLNRLEYLQNLGVNAIELMPVAEFDGNESWGYNPSFHTALDKYYGSPVALKRLIDECHARGMAVILDVVYNHATGQNPYVRLWNDCNGCLEGKPTADNPFFNEEAAHAYSVFHDFNHQSEATRHYVKRSIEYWITEFRIDGFRWDLTKGFTQNCTGANQEACTNSYQTDRVEVLKSYADIQWGLNPEFLVIFEHLGVGTSRDEEEEWARYRSDENPGILLWNNLNHPYSEATMGYHDGGKSDFSDVYGPNRDLPNRSAISFMESHDEERLMYKMQEYGNGSDAYQIQSTATALNRLKLAGAFFFTVPGPKMIWQFGELGYDFPINYNGRTGNKPIRWDYAEDPGRINVYKTFQALIRLRRSNPAFTSSESEVTTDLAEEFKRIILDHPDLDAVIVGNFGVVEDSGKPQFPAAGKWYDYFSGDSITILNSDTIVMLDPGQFHIFTTRKFETPESDILTHTDRGGGYPIAPSAVKMFPNFPNPFDDETRITFHIPASSQVRLEVFDMTGRKVTTLWDGVKQAGKHQVILRAESLSPGVYYCRLTADGQIAVQKIICQ